MPQQHAIGLGENSSTTPDSKASVAPLADNNIKSFRAGVPGVYENIPFNEYLGSRMMSQSVLKQGRDSMRHLKHAIDDPETVKVTDDMALGSALHTAFLEPSLFNERVVLWDGASRRGKDWDNFRDNHRGKIILTEGFYKNAMGMVAALRSHPEVAPWADKIQAVEVSAIGMICGVKCKGRCDALTDDPLWDLKKVRSTDDRTILNTIEEFGYAIQAAMYRRLFNRERFVLCFVEGSPPFDVRPYELDKDWLRIGEAEMMGLLQRYKHCCKTKDWPWRSNKIDLASPPHWKLEEHGMKKAQEITIGGESAFAEGE